MKTITIQSITLLNFKGIRSLSIDLNEKETNIHGANAAGKTTLFDAFRWVLFGKDSQDRKEFNIKTLDENGVAIPRLPHEVTVVLSVDGETVTLRKVYAEKWQKKRGSAEEQFTGHAVECYYNNVPLAAREYDAKIAAICDEQAFKLITNPLYFTGLKKDVQRSMLINLAGDVTYEDIFNAGEHAEYEALAPLLANKTVEELKREVQAKKRKIKEGIDTIPARIDENKRSMPEAYDWVKLDADIKAREATLAHIDEEIADRSKSYNAVAKEKQEIARQLADVRGRITARRFDIKDNLSATYNRQRREHDAAQQRATALRNERNSKAVVLPRLEQELQQAQARREKLIEDWRNIKAMQFEEPNPDTLICPTCKRPLEADDAEAKIAELRDAFNAEVARLFESNKTNGLAAKASIEAKEAEINAIHDACFKLDDEIAALENSEAYKWNGTTPDAEPAIAADEELQGLQARADELQKALDAEAAAPDNGDLQALRQEAWDALEADRAKMRNCYAIDAINARIAELEEEYRKAQAELAELEGTEYQIAAFCATRITMLEERINGMFAFTSFRMFEKQVNGGEVETCEATIDGVPYSDLNNAMKVNVGLDIINTFSRATEVSAPIWIDNRESITDLTPVNAQVINLIVDAEATSLTIK